jgi:MoxR-like ATPase
MPHNPFLQVKADTRLHLPATATFGEAGHLWRQEEIDALILAIAARRPLLVRGEAGSGKSQLARAAAIVLSGAAQNQSFLFDEVLHARFEALDLLYRFDVVERLADAELHRLDETNIKYVKPGKLWQAMQVNQAAAPGNAAAAVLLIDEIDKADADIPNALLGVLGNRSFSVPMTTPPQTVQCERMPLVIISTNEEREMPPAFVRRCIVLNQNPPEADAAFMAWLVARGQAHTHLRIDATAAHAAAEQVLADRKVAIRNGFSKVGLAEYLDLLTALHELTAHEPESARTARQTYWLGRLSAYALVKGADQDQARASLASLAKPASGPGQPAA